MSIDINNVNALFPREGSTTTRRHSVLDSYPKLGLKVIFIGNCFMSGAVELFAKAGCTQAKSIEEAELVVFLGGEDVDPALYGEKVVHRSTYFNKARDDREIDIFAKCIELDKPMFGICRGMQFLHVMNGGKLYQHVGGNHGVTHLIRDNDGKIIRASSMHHQLCIEDDNTFPVAYAWTGNADGKPDEDGVNAWAGYYETGSKTVTDPKHLDLEAAVYPNIKACAVQGHPEVGGYPEYSAWCLNLIFDFLTDKTMMGQNSKIDANLSFL